jgi:pilus assembly protein CpaB
MRNLSKNDGPPNLVAEVVIQNVRLLGLDLNVNPDSTETKVSSTATVEVTMQETQKLSMAANMGTLSLALRRTGAAENETIKPMRTSDLKLVGGYTVAAAPAAASGAPAKPAGPTGPSIIVVNGDKRDSVVVPIESPRGGIWK